MISFVKSHVKAGDRIEFLSDHLTDKGPATATIEAWLDGNVVQVQFGDRHDERQFFTAADIRARIERFVEYAHDGKRLWMVK